MNRETITMDEYGKVFLPYSDEIWMRETELTDLFGIIAPTFRAAVKAIYKGGHSVTLCLANAEDSKKNKHHLSVGGKNYDWNGRCGVFAK